MLHVTPRTDSRSLYNYIEEFKFNWISYHTQSSDIVIHFSLTPFLYKNYSIQMPPLPLDSDLQPSWHLDYHFSRACTTRSLGFAYLFPALRISIEIDTDCREVMLKEFLLNKYLGARWFPLVPSLTVLD